jgi:ATP-dependent protease ClpP protease subunit
MNTITPFYRFRAEAGDEPTGAELLIFDVIGDWEFLGEISAKAFAADLSALPKSVKRLDIHINSPGGSVSEASAIYSRLADHPSTKNVYVDGLAASAATIVAMVGHKIFMRSHALMMVHLPMTIAAGNSDDLRSIAAALDTNTEAMLNLYTKRTGGEREDIRSLMKAETWMSAQDAVDKGFADEVRGVVKAAAIVGNKKAIFNGVTFDLSRFHNVPAFTATTEQQERHTPPMDTPPAAAPAPAAATSGADTPPKPPAPAPAPPTPPPTGSPQPAAAAASAQANDYDKGITAERARIAALQKYDKPATHEIIVKAIADGKTVADITDELFAALEKPAQQQARRTDSSTLNRISGSDTTPSGDDADAQSRECGERLTKAVQAQLGRRGMKRPAALHGQN